MDVRGTKEDRSVTLDLREEGARRLVSAPVRRARGIQLPPIQPGFALSLISSLGWVVPAPRREHDHVAPAAQ